MRRTHVLPRAACAVTAVLLTCQAVLFGGTALADDAQTTIDVLKIVDGDYVVETVTVRARSADESADELGAAPDVVAAAPAVTYETTSTNDPYWQDDDPGEVSHVRSVWDRTRGGGQTVAVLDTTAAINATPITTAPDLTGAAVPGYDAIGGTSDPWHGYGVAGVIAARADNRNGTAGMAPEAAIMPVRVCNDDDGCTSAAVARGILWAADHGADVINMSLAGTDYSDVTAAAISYALDKNISVVASAGNDGLDGNPVMYPAATSGVIAVSATAADGVPSDWAVHGWQVDLSTVGEDVLLTLPGGAWDEASGTSFSGPAVAGAVALLRAQFPGLAVEQIQAALQAGAESTDWNRAWGAGRLDVPAAFQAAERASVGVTASPGPGTATVTWTTVPGATNYTVRVDGVVHATVAGTSTTLTGLTDGSQVAVDVQPDNGSRSSAILATIGPAAPGVPVLQGASLRGTSTDAVLDLTASTSAPFAAEYAVLQDGVSLGTLPLAMTGTPKTFAIGIGPMPDYQSRWQLRAVDPLGRMSTDSNAVTAGTGTPPAPPPITGLTAHLDGADALLTWDDLGTAYTYRVREGSDDLASPRSAGAVVPAPGAGAQRTWSVTAVDAWGQAGQPVTVAVTSPGVPGIGTAEAGVGSALVRWTAPQAGAQPITGYVVQSYRDSTLLTTTRVSAGTTSATVPSLTAGFEYTFTVAATTAAGTGPASAHSVGVTPTATVPTEPSIWSTSTGNGSATAHWLPPTSDGGSTITGYTLQALFGSTVKGTVTTSGSATTATVTGLTNGTTYILHLRAINDAGTGLAALSQPVTPYGTPGAPGIGTPTPGDGSATARWTAPPNNGSFITGFTVRTYRSTTLVRTDPAANGSTSLAVPGLSNGTAYTFTVTATNGVGEGPASAASAPVTPRALPGAPVIGTPEADDGSVTVRWSAPASDGGSPLTGYTVQAFRGTTSTGTTAASAGATSVVVTGLTNGTPYTFTVTATNAAGTGSPSAASTAVTPRTRPAAPVIGTPIVRNGSAAVRWSAPATDGGSPVTGYTVHTYQGGNEVGTTWAPAGATSVIVSGLDNGTAYTFAVTATNAVGTGTASAQSSPVTPATVSSPIDLSIVHRLGSGMNLWRLSTLEASSGGPRLLASLNYGGFSYDGSVTLPGDFGAVTASDDGSPDEIIWHAQPNGGVLVWAVGGGTDPAPKLWRDLRTGGWSWALSRPLAGDVTGDGIDDLVVRHANGPSGVNLWVLRGDGHTVGAPELWGSTTGGLDQRAELADVDGDGREDLVLARPVSGSSGLVYDVMRASGTSFGTRTTAFTGSIAGGWSPSSRLAVGDVTGDGRVDLVTSHAQLGNPGLLVWVHENCSTGTDVCFRAPTIWQDLRTGGWSFAASRQYLADTDADGDADLITLHAQQGNPGLLVWRARSDGTRLLAPQVAADLRAGGWSYLDSRSAVG